MKHAITGVVRSHASKAWAAVLVAAAIVLVLVSLVYLALASAQGRVWLRDQICRAVSSGIQGTLEIDKLTEVQLPRVKASGVRILAPNGVAAIDVASADIVFDLRALLRGDFAWQRAEIRDGIVRVTEDERGRVNMEETFRARPGEQSAARLDMRTMVTSNMRLEIYGGELPSLRLVNIHG